MFLFLKTISKATEENMLSKFGILWGKTNFLKQNITNSSWYLIGFLIIRLLILSSQQQLQSISVIIHFQIHLQGYLHLNISFYIPADFWLKSLYRNDLIALFPPQFSQNCTMNDWGTNLPREVRNRIKDKFQDPSVGQVIYEPYLNKVDFPCTGVNSCSGHGFCIAPNVCQCEPEWDGLSCSNHSCSNVYNCLGRGDCIGLDTCSCNNGWTGQDCSFASCEERNNCSGRGTCIKPNE